MSWRFRELGDAFPIVLITAPADRRLATDRDDSDHRPVGTCDVRTSVLGGYPIVRCTCRLDGREAHAMKPTGGNRYGLTLTLHDGARSITVEAEDETGSIGRETIELAGDGDLAADRRADGSDADAIGAWAERGIFGTQLGPNRNGRHW